MLYKFCEARGMFSLWSNTHCVKGAKLYQCQLYSAQDINSVLVTTTTIYSITSSTTTISFSNSAATTVRITLTTITTSTTLLSLRY